MMYVYDPGQDSENNEENDGEMQRKYSVLDDVEFEKHFDLENS